jgi:hypothetical protein
MKNMIEREQHLKKSELVTLLASCKMLPGETHTNAPSDFEGGRALQVDETHVICWMAAFEEFGKVEQ